jgi:glycosyltransferase involved in cell wall biosynthesis
VRAHPKFGSSGRRRLAIVVSHPIQYYTPLYRALALRADIEIKVFFTWHAAQAPVYDRGFHRPIAWDIPLTEGYAFEQVPNVSADPGTHRFFGLQNPSLVERVLSWNPEAVHITGWAGYSHLKAMRAFARRGIPVLFRGDSHLLDSETEGVKWRLKQAVLQQVYSRPTAFLYVGQANRAYYEALGVHADRLFPCPHSIDVRRFAEPASELERQAGEWREQLGLRHDQLILLFAGKFEDRKQTVDLMRAVSAVPDARVVLVLVGGGEREAEVQALARTAPGRFRVLPFQNQQKMPLVYRLGHVFVMPSAFGETWGLAVNEAIACGRPVLASSRVGCAADVVDSTCGAIFPWNDFSVMMAMLRNMVDDRKRLADMERAAARRAWMFDIKCTEDALIDCINQVCGK